MNFNNTKSLIENVIVDLAENEPLSKILLKVQVVAHQLKNEKFRKWIENEMNGSYKTKGELPEYRICNCEVLSNISNGHGILKNLTISTEMFSNKDATYLAKHVLFYEAISEIDNYANCQKSLKKMLPNVVLHYINQTLNPGWNTIDAWQTIPGPMCKTIIDTFKSKLLQFFLELNEEIGINVDFDAIQNKNKIEKIMNTTINAGVVTTGPNASLNISNSNVVGGINNQLIISEETRNEIEKIVKEIADSIEIFINSQDEVISELNRIQTQLKKENPKAGIIKNSFEFLKKLFTEVVAVGTAPVVLEGINKAIELIK